MEYHDYKNKDNRYREYNLPTDYYPPQPQTGSGIMLPLILIGGTVAAAGAGYLIYDNYFKDDPNKNPQGAQDNPEDTVQSGGQDTSQEDTSQENTSQEDTNQEDTQDADGHDEDNAETDDTPNSEGDPELYGQHVAQCLVEFSQCVALPTTAIPVCLTRQTKCLADNPHKPPEPSDSKSCTIKGKIHECMDGYCFMEAGFPKCRLNKTGPVQGCPTETMERADGRCHPCEDDEQCSTIG